VKGCHLGHDTTNGMSKRHVLQEVGYNSVGGAIVPYMREDPYWVVDFPELLDSMGLRESSEEGGGE